MYRYDGPSEMYAEIAEAQERLANRSLDPAHGTTGCEACDGECSQEAREAFEAAIESPEAYAARGGMSWEGWMSS